MARNLIVVVLGLMTPLMGMASVEDDATSLSYISYLERYATIQPASEEATIEAAINMPLVAGDRIDTAREARVEAILADGSYLWLDEYTSVSLDSVAFSRDTRGDRTVIFLADGVLMIELLPDVARPNRTRIDGGSETIYLEEVGVYRVEVLQTGGLWVEVWEGLVEAKTPVGGVVLRSGSASELSGGRVSGVQARLTDRDDFARWVQSRRQIGIGESAQYVDARYGREASQLDSYGNWIYVSNSDTWAWQPTVSGDWRPYTSGRWYWTSTGWCWQSYEPWGWLPYHYGSWWNSPSYGWVWGWGRTWSPAWVYWSHSPGWIGWCPMGWYSSWWWGSGWGWGGHYPGHGGGYYPPHGGGGGQARPPRGNVVPRLGEGGSAQIRSGRAVAAGDLMLDIEGRTRTSSLRGDGWSVVSDRDFSSPRIGRIVRSAVTLLAPGAQGPVPQL
ncbi:MAG: FecR family protein [Thermoanaerobaculales bacterium]|nr:FecR family protein [Thermoanaerobaculales bacterium]